MKKHLLFLVSLAVAGLAHAATPSAESVATLLNVMHAEELVRASSDNVERMMRQAVAQATAGKPMSDSQRRTLDGFIVKYSATVRDEMSWDKVEPLYAQIYMESFTQEDIDGLIAFYRSPTGQAYVAKMPAVMAKVTGVLQQQIARMLSKMQADMRQAIRDAQPAK